LENDDVDDDDDDVIFFVIVDDDNIMAIINVLSFVIPSSPNVLSLTIKGV